MSIPNDFVSIPVKVNVNDSLPVNVKVGKQSNPIKISILKNVTVQGGGSGGDKYFVQEFAPTASLIVVHNLHKYPAVTVLNSAGDEVEGDVLHINTNTLQVNFSAPFGGKITCN